MTVPSLPKSAYTDAPEQHPNLILGSLQLLFWLGFRPSAWRNHVTHIAPALRPDFGLVELHKADIHNPQLRKLLLQVYGVWPLLIGLTVGGGLWMTGQSNDTIIFGITTGLATGLAVSIALGIGTLMAIGVAFGLANGIASSALNGAASGMGHGIAISVVIGLTVGIASSLTGTIARPTTTYSLARQIGGVMAGAVGGVMAAVAVGVMFSLALGVETSIAFGIAIGVAFSVEITVRSRQWLRGIVFGLGFGLSSGKAFSIIAMGAFDGTGNGEIGIGSSIAIGIAVGIWWASLFALPFALTEWLAGTWAGVAAGSLASAGFWIVAIILYQQMAPWVGLLGFLGLGLGLTFTLWRPILTYPGLMIWNTLLYQFDEQHPHQKACLLSYHAAFWDEHQPLRWPGLEDHVVLIADRTPLEAQAAIDYLSTTRQSWATKAAQIELEARSLERCSNAATIGQSHTTLAPEALAGPGSSLLRSFSHLSEDIQAALNQVSSYNQRLALAAILDRLEGLLRELTRSSDPYAVRFRPIAKHWHQLLTDHIQTLAQQVELRQEIDSPYIIGVPLTQTQEIFTGRTDIASRIEQLLLDRRRPPLLLYGQRRTGKTSLLNNLRRLLPNRIIPLFVDLQGPASRASDAAGFLYNLSRDMAKSADRQAAFPLPPLNRDDLVTDPFTRFDEWLDQVEQTLGSHTALLALDEFEVLDKALTEGRFSEADVLGMLRNLIQHRPQFKLLVSGSHHLQEFQRWASYLINAQVIHLGYLTETETRQLVERPVQDFALRYEPDASQRVLDLTRGHPFLVQLLCAEIVVLKNEQDPAVRRLATLADVEAAVPEALASGSMFFSDIEGNQVDDAGRALLNALAAQGEGAILTIEALEQAVDGDLATPLAHLLRRELIEAAPQGYRIQVELIRRWFDASLGNGQLK